MECLHINDWRWERIAIELNRSIGNICKQLEQYRTNIVCV
jgi:hypothetical protein